MTIYVNVYEVDQAYGGPEEGGWWYTISEPVISRIVPSMTFAKEVQKRLREDYPSTGQMYSSRNQGDWEVIIENHPAEFYPKERPHYE